MKDSTLLPFDMTEFLDSDEAMRGYLSQVLEEGDTDEVIRALGISLKQKAWL